MRDYENTAKALRCCRLTSARGCAECPYSVNNNEKCAHLLNDAADAIEELLAAVPKQGEWVMSEEFKGYAMCSRCEDAFVDPEWIAKDGKWNYCPNCGARMEPPKEDAK